MNYKSSVFTVSLTILSIIADAGILQAQSLDPLNPAKGVETPARKPLKKAAKKPTKEPAEESTTRTSNPRNLPGEFEPEHKSRVIERVDVNIFFASNFIDRGEDVFASNARQKSRSYGAHTGAPVFQPEIFWHTPTQGLSVSLRLSLALASRPDQDLDRFIQTGPDGADKTLEARAILSGAGSPFLCVDTCEQTRYYSEEVGLRREDRFIPTIAYERETRMGILGFGITTDGKLNPREDEHVATTEFIIKYASPFLPELALEISSDMQNSERYFALMWEQEIMLTDSQSLVLLMSAGYGVRNKLRGVQDITLNPRYYIGNFFVGAIVSYRPKLAFFDEDEDADSTSPYWLAGGSSRSDGLVVDPSRQNGYINQALNLYIENYFQTTLGAGAGYSYSPRQKMPRTIWALQMGYTLYIE